jgi:hypothetical protein
MKYDFEKLKKEIPEDYHFLLHSRLYSTDEMQDSYRIEGMNRVEFNKCERCGYDLFTPKAYSKNNPANGYVSYYHQYRLVLCDKCVDELNGQPWK